MSTIIFYTLLTSIIFSLFIKFNPSSLENINRYFAENFSEKSERLSDNKTNIISKKENKKLEEESFKIFESR
jgi:hypothetical protein